MKTSSELAFDMLRIRMIEERIAKEYPNGKMRCPVHLSIGQEAAAVGICSVLTKDDKMVSTHRAHAHYLAKGGSINGLIGELYGKSTGCSRGNGGSMHLIDLAVGFFGSTSIVGGTIPVGVGLAFADHLKGSEATTVVCIGDAATEEGVFHEAANFASLHKLKVIFACENNMYSCYTHIKDRQPNRTFQAVANCHDLHYYRAGHELLSIQNLMSIAKQQRGPSFIEIPTYRYLQHCGPDNDDHLGYRGKEEIAYWAALDQVKRDPSSHNELLINAEIDEAFRHAEEAPFPYKTEAGRYVYADS